MNAPGWLSDAAKQEWARVIANGFCPSGPAEAATLAAYAQNYARWQDAEKVLQSEGAEIVIRDDKGNVKRVMASPQVGLAHTSQDRMIKAAARLGLLSPGAQAQPTRRSMGPTLLRRKM